MFEDDHLQNGYKQFLNLDNIHIVRAKLNSNVFFSSFLQHINSDQITKHLFALNDIVKI